MPLKRHCLKVWALLRQLAFCIHFSLTSKRSQTTSEGQLKILSAVKHHDSRAVFCRLNEDLCEFKVHLPPCPLFLSVSPWSYLLWRVFTGEHPGPVWVHSEVPTSWGTAVQVGPGDDGPVHMTDGVLFRKGGGARGKELSVGLWLISCWVILWGVVLLR